jgi:monoamine oxidase
MIHDAVIVGAGLSGLVCARRLIDAGARAIVVEARPRVGGRLHSGRVGGAVVDLGGHWLSVDQPRLLALARALGVASSPQPRAGRPVLDDGLGLFAQLRALVAQRRAVRRIDRLARRIPAGAPGAAGDAAALDAIAVGPWLAGAIANPAARERIAMHAELVFAVDPAGLSLLDYLARLGATGGFAPRGPDLPGGGRDHRFVGGAQRLAIRLADGLGAAVRLGEPVQAIEAGGAGPVIVRGPAGSHAARRAVLALPPSLAIRIAPDLPAPLHRLGAALQRGAVVKCFAAYDRAFWRDAGLSGEAYRPRGTVRAVVDASPPDGAAAVLLAFVVGAAAEAWQRRDPADRRGEVLGALAALFGDAARAPSDYLEADWAADAWSAGCVASAPPGALAAGAVWRGAHGRLHLAGTEAAVRWPGYMEGAIEAGERAADEALAALAPGGAPGRCGA